MSNDIVPAHLAVQAMRDNGYKNAAYAIAELMDNAIQAGATIVELLCAERTDLVEQRRRTRIYQIGVLDNGCGMDAEVLKIALQFGNGTHLTADHQNGMGRFGMGLPSASISQCARVEVWSWQRGVESALYTYLDVSAIREGNQKSLPEPTAKPLPQMWREAGDAFGPSGTLVVWSKLDRIMWRTSEAIIDNSELLVGRMYRRFLHDGVVSIRMVSFDADSPLLTREMREARPNDPGYLMDHTSCPDPFGSTAMFEPWQGDHYEIRHKVHFNDADHIVTTRFSVAKKEARQVRQGVNPGSLEYGKHADRNTGISIMRAGRELDLDQSWVIKYDSTERWWGVEIEFPPSLDELFGVTNNKQSARNFAELSKIDLDTLTKGRTITEAMEELIADGDPSAPLLEIVHRIRVNLPIMREWLKKQTANTRSPEKRHDPNSPEAIATAVTRELQQQGHSGVSDKAEQLPPAQRRAEIEQTLVSAGVPEEAAKELAASTVSDGLKYVFAESDMETYAFFTVRQSGGALVITLNTGHPAFSHLVDVVSREENGNDAAKLQARLTRAADGLKLLLSAWARYEDEQTDNRKRDQVKDARADWGRMARRFLEREE